MSKYCCTPIEEIKDFDRVGHHYTKVSEKNNYHLWRMDKENQDYPSYEIWKGKKYTQPDGTKIRVKPSDEDFGTYGWYLTGNIYDSLEKMNDKFEDFPYEEFKEAIGRDWTCKWGKWWKC